MSDIRIKDDDVILSCVGAQEILDAIDFAITNVLEMSMVAVDYGNVEKLGMEMEMLHRLRMAQARLREEVPR